MLTYRTFLEICLVQRLRKKSYIVWYELEEVFFFSPTQFCMCIKTALCYCVPLWRFQMMLVICFLPVTEVKHLGAKPMNHFLC